MNDMKNLFFTICLLVTCTSYLLAQNSGSYIDYDDSYQMSEPIVQSSNPQTVCDGQRNDISTLPSEQQGILASLIIEYLEAVENPNYNQGVDPTWLKYDVVAQHSDYGNLTPPGSSSGSGLWHSNNETFFSWHRDYMQGLENWLLEKGHSDFVPLPGWNPNTAMPNAFKTALVDGVPPLGNTNFTADMYEVDDITCGQFSSMDQFAGYIRAEEAIDGITSHNQVHQGLGGAMGSVPTASGAAIFWLFHAHVDELYQCYQERCQDCEPVFIRATHAGRNCDYCFDFSLNVNADEINVTLIDENGVSTVIPWSSSRNCIPYNYLSSGQSYTAVIEGNNSTNESCSARDQVSIEFTAPVQPAATKFNRNPCLKVEQVPQFPTNGFHPNDGGDTKSFTVKNTGDDRIFTFYNTVIQTGYTNQIGTSIQLLSDEQITINIPNQYVGYGNNYFVVQVDGDTAETQYFIAN